MPENDTGRGLTPEVLPGERGASLLGGWLLVLCSGSLSVWIVESLRLEKTFKILGANRSLR